MANSSRAQVSEPAKPEANEIAARCHEIQTGLGFAEVPEFEKLRAIGMAVRVALHIRRLPPVNYETLRLVASHFLGIPTVAMRTIVELLAEIEFVKLHTEGKTIRTVVPNVPYYETLYLQLGSSTAFFASSTARFASRNFKSGQVARSQARLVCANWFEGPNSKTLLSKYVNR